MTTTRTRTRVTSLVGAIVMLLPVSVSMAQGPESLAMAGDQRDKNRPVEVTFTKWVLLNSVNMEGVTGGAVPGVGEGQTGWRESACSTASSWLGGAPARGCRWPGSVIWLPIPSAWTQAHPQA
jgi:hypothetical protein